MKKMHLNLAQGAGEILTKGELKKILGGIGSGSDSGSSGDIDCPTSKDQCSGTCKKGGIIGRCGWTKVPEPGWCSCATAGGS